MKNKFKSKLINKLIFPENFNIEKPSLEDIDFLRGSLEKEYINATLEIQDICPHNIVFKGSDGINEYQQCNVCFKQFKNLAIEK